MSKSILTIDTPERCSECIAYYLSYGSGYCQAADGAKMNPKPKTRPDWCPLKDLKDDEFVVVAHTTKYTPSFDFEETYDERDD